MNISEIEKVEIVFKDGVGYDSEKLIQSVQGIGWNPVTCQRSSDCFTTFVFGQRKLKLASYPMPPDTGTQRSSAAAFLMTCQGPSNRTLAQLGPPSLLFQGFSQQRMPRFTGNFSDECHVIPCNGTLINVVTTAYLSALRKSPRRHK